MNKVCQGTLCLTFFLWLLWNFNQAGKDKLLLHIGGSREFQIGEILEQVLKR